VTRRQSSRRMKAEVLNTCDRRIAKDVAALVRELNPKLMPGPCTVSVVLVDDAKIRELNRRFLRRDRPTDVLAFPMPERVAGGTEGLLGEVYVSRDRAREQAKHYGVKYHDEVRRLVLHGILHLLGLKHAEMESLYERMLGKTG
jgi:probable rRNA maturation factor